MNLLFIFTDEQRYDTLKAYGNEIIEAPNLNALAEEGIVFEKAYVTQPVCTPSRSSIMTGLYPHTNGCTRNNLPLIDDFKTIVECDDFTEYRKGYYGKWHLGDEIFLQHGFDDWISFEDEYRPWYSEKHDHTAYSDYHHWLLDKGYTPPNKLKDGSPCFSRSTACRMKEEHCKPAFIAEKASEFITENSNNPFILYINFLEPHMPFFGPRDDQYDPMEVTLPENFNMIPDENTPHHTRLRIESSKSKYKQFMDTEEPTELDWRKLIARYWGMVSQVDTAVGRILDTLKKSGAYDDTLIVFTSDHGDMMGSHRFVTKDIQYEEAVRVPLIMKIPGAKANGGMISAPVGQIDLAPTLLDYLGKKIPDEIQGYSWKPMLEGTGELIEKNVFVEWSPQVNGEERDKDHSIRTIITPDGWKFNWELYGEHELYNLKDDPHEAHNLYGRTEFRLVVDELITELKNWQNRTDDQVVFPDPE